MQSIYYFADVNECETGKHHCDSNAFCNNTKALTIVHANQNLQETVLTAQVNNKAAVQPSAEAGESADKKRAIKR